jgi:hypothetical protein
MTISHHSFFLLNSFSVGNVLCSSITFHDFHTCELRHCIFGRFEDILDKLSISNVRISLAESVSVCQADVGVHHASHGTPRRLTTARASHGTPCLSRYTVPLTVDDAVSLRRVPLAAHANLTTREDKECESCSLVIHL